ncbi:MAP7 domain-containing protein 3 isoform X1 [Heterocephalus glaber]|uniref:MAP7 domain-containing protein 3 isoform X1 n=1 Tax=Heterocephalus glaber TaxID=10181 RepID=A0AAX6PZ99_HETGA|nr:MAP7 domain-containing protein 3 isoform X1 [Heterocephalus glaber]
MAEHAVRGGSGSTSLRGLRERMVAEAQAIAKERRSQSGVCSLPAHSPNIRSTVKPVIDGSVLKNDMKQKLAKERREERKRQEEASKELQLLEKERKAKLQYEKHLEEKQRKLREQKEKDERRRISAEEKRKQKLEEERERYKAVLSRTLERSNHIDHRQKRWSWEGSTMMNSENKLGKTENKRSSSLNRRESKMHSSNATGHMEDKLAHRFHNNTPENNLISHLLIPTKASVARSKSAASLSIPGKENTGVTKKYLLQYVHTPPLRSHSSEQLKTSSMHSKSTEKIPPQTKVDAAPLEKVEAPLKAKVKASPTASSAASREELPKVKLESAPRVSVDATPGASMDMTLMVSSEATPEMSMDTAPSLSWEATPGESTDMLTEVSRDTSSEVSMETSSLTSVEASPVVSLDTSPEVSTDASPVASMDFSPEGSVKASLEGMQELPGASVEAPSRANTEAGPKTSVEESHEEGGAAPPEVLVEATPQASVEEPPKEPCKKPEVDKQTSNPVSKKRPLGNIPRYKWPSSPTKERHPPSPITTMQNQKNRPPSPLPGLKQPSQSPSHKIIPIQRTLFVPNALGTFKKKRETVSKTTNEFEAVSQKRAIHEESGNKSTPGTMSAEEATKILAERRRLAREQKDKKEEERLQKEVEPRKAADVSKKVEEAQVEEFSKCEDRQQEKEIEKSKGYPPQEDQRIMQQKGDTKIKAHEEADKRKKEHERIMLQNLQERLERKKRIEEIMKRTRKTDVNASKAMEISSNDTTEEDEADDEETESDEDSLDDMFTSGIGNGRDSSTKLTMPYKNATRMPQKQAVLQAKTGEVDKEQTAYFNGDVKTFRQEDPTDSSNDAKGSGPSTKRTSTRTEKPSKVREASTSTLSTQSVTTNQERICDQGFDFASHNTNAESPATDSTANSYSHNLRDSMASQQSSSTPSDSEERSEPVSTQSDV